MSNNFKYIGKSIPRHDVLEKVSGDCKYVGDIKVSDMLHARLLTSEIAYGDIIYIDKSEALKMDGVVAIYTYEDVPKEKFSSHIWIEGMNDLEDELLLTNRPLYYGDKIAMVVAISDKIAKIAVTKLKVKYNKKTPLIDMHKALTTNEESFSINGNKPFNKKIQIGDTKSIFEKHKNVVTDTIVTPKIHHAAMENHVCLVIPEISGITIYTPCQIINQVQFLTSKILNIEVSKVRVVKTTIGGSFGGKSQPILEPLAAFAALKLQKPVRVMMDRKQSITTTRSRHNTYGEVKVAVDENGKIQARDINVLTDTGAYYSNGTAVAMAMGKKAFRMYDIKNQTYNANTVHTNTAVGGACRGYGSPQIHAITEVSIENTAKRLGLDPVKFRLDNLVKPYSKDPTGGTDLGDAMVIECVKRGSELFDWDIKYSRKKDLGRYRRGVGMAVVTHGNGYYGAFPEFTNIQMTVNNDGRIVVNSAIHDLGCGTVTIMQQIVAEILEIDPSNITVLEGDTLRSPSDSAGTQASRVTYVVGKAFFKASTIMLEKIKESASILLNTHTEKINYSGGKITSMETKEELTLSELSKKSKFELNRPIEIFCEYVPTTNPAVYGSNFVELEVDTLTGHVKILDFVVVHDIGRVLNHGFVMGQIYGGVAMSIGMAISEEFEYDKEGKQTNVSFAKYHIPNAPDVPKLRVELIETADNDGPFGAKSVGEACTCAAAPAILNAINHALETNISVFPATPERIIKAFHYANR